jgi:hypothetical protein
MRGHFGCLAQILVHEGRFARQGLSRAAFGWNRHRGSEATWRSRVAGRPTFPWIASPRVPKPGGRNDGPGSTEMRLPPSPDGDLRGQPTRRAPGGPARHVPSVRGRAGFPSLVEVDAKSLRRAVSLTPFIVRAALCPLIQNSMSASAKRPPSADGT